MVAIGGGALALAAWTALRAGRGRLTTATLPTSRRRPVLGLDTGGADQEEPADEGHDDRSSGADERDHELRVGDLNLDNEPDDHRPPSIASVTRASAAARLPS